MLARRFPPPWSVEELDACPVVTGPGKSSRMSISSLPGNIACPRRGSIQFDVKRRDTHA